MQNVPLSDQLFTEAQRKAGAIGMSLERFVAEAVRLHLSDDLDESATMSLSAEQVAIIRKSQAEIREGKGLTMAQVEQQLAANKAAWLETRPR